jgi:alpha-beta hydrolase superfamily lysophospholipase
MATFMPMTEGAFEGVGGIKIFTRAWQPAGKPHGVVVISHGFNSGSGQYEWAAQQLAAKGLAVYALDHRGRGKSEGERFFVEKFSDYTGDLATFIDMVKAREPGLPVFLLGHSAGGVISCGYALEHQGELAGLICESFAYQVPTPGKDFRLMTLPLLILHGAEDKPTKPSGSRELYEKAGSTDKMLKLYEGHFHDLLADVGKQQVMADIQAWIDAHLGTTIPRGGRELRV